MNAKEAGRGAGAARHLVHKPDGRNAAVAAPDAGDIGRGRRSEPLLPSRIIIAENERSWFLTVKKRRAGSDAAARCLSSP